MTTYDLAVVGAGPAGLSAAVTAAEAGLRVALVDGAARPGGQFYRTPDPRFNARRAERLHHAWPTYADLIARLGRSTVDQLPRHQVWTIERGFTIRALVDGDERTVSADSVLIATGAFERQIPFPGWTLPGVVTAGGAQAMLKANLVLPGKNVVVAGTGPLLLTVAAGLASAGARIAGLYEANSVTGYLPHTPAVVANPGKLFEGVEYGSALLRHRIGVRTRHAVVAAHGTDRLEAVTVAKLDRDWNIRSTRTVACDALAVGYGLTAQLELALELGCATTPDGDGQPVLATDAQMRTTVDNVWAAGETAGVGGAQLSIIEGELAALSIARQSPSPKKLQTRKRLRAFAAALHAAHPVRPGWTSWLTDETLVCRCEEVPVSAVREAVEELGASDARSVKLLTRTGMGWCQGRMCGTGTACLTAHLCGREATSGELTATRPVAQPVPLRLLAEGVTTGTSDDTVTSDANLTSDLKDSSS